jgi:hypothetical protein
VLHEKVFLRMSNKFHYLAQIQKQILTLHNQFTYISNNL